MSFIPNKVEKRYIARLLTIKPDCTGVEMLRLISWCNKHDMKGVDGHYKMDDWIKDAITHPYDPLI